MRPPPVPAERRAGGIIQILQDYGSALFSIGKQKNPHFVVETPYLAAVVKGTTFIITVTGEGASLQVTEGAIEASTRDCRARELVRPGAVAMIAAGDPLRMVIEGEGRRVIDPPAHGGKRWGASGGAARRPRPRRPRFRLRLRPTLLRRTRPRPGRLVLPRPRRPGTVPMAAMPGSRRRC